jgi:type I restriction enzyme M protein
MKDYHFNMLYSTEDEEYSADIPDLKHCFASGETPEEARHVRKVTSVGDGNRTPGSAAAVEDDGEPFEEKMARLTATLREQFAESARLERIIEENLRRLGDG